jgi:hypothetical protein
MSQIVCYGCRLSLDHSDHLRRVTRACENCLKDLVVSRTGDLPEYLDALEHPAALLAQDHTVLYANRQFQHLQLDKTVVGQQVGEVLGCMYAPLLGRCGETVACILCSLRRAVERTWLTGKGLRGVSMSYPHKVETRRSVSVTTEKIGESVLVILESSSENAPV